MAGVYIPGGNGVQPWKTSYNGSAPSILWDSGAYGEAIGGAAWLFANGADGQFSALGRCPGHRLALPGRRVLLSRSHVSLAQHGTLTHPHTSSSPHPQAPPRSPPPCLMPSSATTPPRAPRWAAAGVLGFLATPLILLPCWQLFLQPQQQTQPAHTLFNLNLCRPSASGLASLPSPSGTILSVAWHVAASSRSNPLIHSPMRAQVINEWSGIFTITSCDAK